MGSVLHIMSVLPHIALDDAGFECIAQVEMGPPSVSRTMAITFSKMEAWEKVSASVMHLFVAWSAPQYTFKVLALCLAKFACAEISIEIWPLTHEGKSIIPKAPGRFQKYIVGFVMGL